MNEFYKVKLQKMNNILQLNTKDNENVFVFTDENKILVNKIIAKYPPNRQRSAVMPLLHLAQKQTIGNWISRSAIKHIADLLEMQPIHVYEVVTFYTMYNKHPVGLYMIQICRTTSCWLCGSDTITEFLKQKLGIEIGETTTDGLFTLIEVECLSACINAPVIQINDDYYENLNIDKIKVILDNLINKHKLK